MALTEKQIEMFGDEMVELYQAFEQDVIADIARRVKKTGRLTETAELMAKTMYEAGADTQKIRGEVMKTLRADDEYKKFVANNTKQYKRDVISKIRQLQKQAKIDGDRIIAESGDMSFNKDLSMWHQAGKKLTKDSYFVRMVDEMKDRTNGTLKNLTRTMGFKGVHDFVSIENAYIRYLDKATLKVATGTFSFDQAANDCVKELAQSGLRCVEYASGRTYQLDTAVRMCIRTSCTQLSANISMHNCDKTGTDLVEVDSHWGAREEHQVWQGKIYSRSGKNKKYPPFSDCHYGAVDGLCGVNCRHTFYPFFEGISEPNTWPKEPEPKEYKGKTYSYTQATQKQRKMERDIRSTKREIEAQKVLKGDTTVLEARKRKQINEYHQFSSAMEIRPKDNRLRVIGGSSNLNYKTAKLLTKTEKRGIFKLSKSGNTYLNKNDMLYANALKIKPIDEYTDIVSHGDPYSIVFKDADGVESNVSAKEFTEIIKKSGAYNGGNIRLIACQTGAGDGIVPQYIANELGVNVLAPTEIVNVDFNGKMILADNEIDAYNEIETGEWKVFKPRKE